MSVVVAAVLGFSPCIVGEVAGSTFVTDCTEAMVASGEAPASNEPFWVISRRTTTDKGELTDRRTITQFPTEIKWEACRKRSWRTVKEENELI